MDINEAKSLIKSLPNHISVNLRGQPGIGKTWGVQELAEEVGARCHVFLACTMDPVDMAGIPQRSEKGFTEFCPPRWGYELSTDNKEYDGPAIAFFDDLPTADENVQAAFFRMVHNREVGIFKLRDNVRIIAAGNRSTDKAAVKEMPTPLRNRFLHIDVDIDPEAWARWAIQKSLHPGVIGFIRTLPNNINSFNPKSNEYAFATPRSWHMTSDCLKPLGGSPIDHMEVISGLIGQGIAIEFSTWCEQTESVKSPKEILENPDSIELPDIQKIDIIHATTCGVAAYVANKPSRRNVVRAFKYALRYYDHLKEYGVILALDLNNILLSNKKIEEQDRLEIIKSKSFLEFSEKYNPLLDS